MATKSERIQAELSSQAAKDALTRARARLRSARAQWRHARATLRRWYRSARARARARMREYRIRERQRVRDQIAQWWAELRAKWVARKAEIDALALAGVEKAKRVRVHRQERARELAKHERRAATSWADVRKAERAAESDQDVIRDLEAHHPELVAIFRSMSARIKGSARRSRTEAMLEWAEENPDEVWALRSAHDERELQEAIREHEAAERAARPGKSGPRKAIRSRKPRRYAEAVPF